MENNKLNECKYNNLKLEIIKISEKQYLQNIEKIFNDYILIKEKNKLINIYNTVDKDGNKNQ